jgi:hypothetical protein
MSREVFNVELGLAISAENGLDQAFILSGSAVPDGTSGKQSEAPIGSIYLRSGTGELYQKIANAGAPADWELNGTSTAMLGNWRPERVDAHTGQVLSAGTTDPTAWSDNDGGADGDDFTVGHYILDGNCDLFEITAITSATNITIALAASQPAAQDMFGVRYNLPDPAGQEGQAIITYDGTNCIKVADVDFANASGISVDSGYTAGSGDPVAGDSVLQALQKIDGNNDNQDTLLGTAQGAVDLGTFSGATIPDNVTVKSALQSLETAYEETDANVDDLITLSGVPENSTDLGTFTGAIISDNTTVKNALQELETFSESEAADQDEIDQNVDDLITLSGRPENSVDHGTFTGTLFADNQTSNALFQRIEDLLEEIKVVEVTGITTSTPVDSVPVATVSACKWLVEAFEEATPANKQAVEVYALNNGSAVDDTVYAKLKVGSNFNLSISVDISGGNMRLLASSSTAGVTVRARRVQVTNI